MVSLLHEGVIKLVRDHPAFAADLLGDVLELKLPHFRRAQLVDVTLTELAPVEYRADAVVVFTRKRPVFGVIIEAQLRPDRAKRLTWPLYAVAARAREQCPFVVLVVTPSAATARWAARAIDLGGGNLYRSLVVGPDGIPKVTDPARARREPQLAVLSVMAHGRGQVKTAAAIGAVAARAILRFPEDKRLLYSLLIESNLSEAARKAIEMQPGLDKFFSAAQRKNFERGRAEGKAEGKTEGRVEGKAEALLRILKQRGLAPSANQQRRIIECADPATLERWLDRSLAVASLEELFASPLPTLRRRGGPEQRAAPGNGRRKAR
jgi:hypothetical protein